MWPDHGSPSCSARRMKRSSSPSGPPSRRTAATAARAETGSVTSSRGRSRERLLDAGPADGRHPGILADSGRVPGQTEGRRRSSRAWASQRKAMLGASSPRASIPSTSPGEQYRKAAISSAGAGTRTRPRRSDPDRRRRGTPRCGGLPRGRDARPGDCAAARRGGTPRPAPPPRRGPPPRRRPGRDTAAPGESGRRRTAPRPPPAPRPRRGSPRRRRGRPPTCPIARGCPCPRGVSGGGPLPGRSPGGC